VSKIYVASSWRNELQPKVVAELRHAGHEVYDFKNPRPGDRGFSWAEIDPDWKNWTVAQFRAALQHPLARSGFGSDLAAMYWATAFCLVLPCGRSAHLEAGWAMGRSMPCSILIPSGAPIEPELMYLLAIHGASSIFESTDGVVGFHAAPKRFSVCDGDFEP
jgi:hypothetical protein